MPYIKPEKRQQYDNSINVINYFIEKEAFQVGDITYILYRIIHFWWKSRRSYLTICQIRGVLAGVIDEFNRREAHPYEDTKIKENGDI